MKRIGILTYHRSINYGAVMQAQALASELAVRFPEAEIKIIDYNSKKMSIYYKLTTLYRGMDSVFQIFSRIKMYRAFIRGISKLPLSEEKLVSDNPATFFNMINNRFDIIVVGSDAVWNYSRRGFPNPYFLERECGAVKVSYAASCNGLPVTSINNIENEKIKIIKKSFDGFSYIGVRDAMTESFVTKAAPQAKVSHNCDPTFLLTNLKLADKTELIRKLEIKYNINFNKPIIGLMLSNHNGDFSSELVKRIKLAYGNEYQIVSIYSYNKYADFRYIADLTPQEWSMVFGLFSVTISKYFHGTLLSLLNGTPVIAVGAEKGLDNLPGKVEDVLTRLNLEDFHFPAKSKDDIDWNLFMAKLDECLKNPPIERINKGIQKERKTAESFFDAISKLLSGNNVI